MKLDGELPQGMGKISVFRKGIKEEYAEFGKRDWATSVFLFGPPGLAI
jgi:hypothetical protein